MLTLSTLTYYPIKSCRGFNVDSTFVERRGLQHDRRMMIVDPEGLFLTQRDEPRLARIIPALNDNFLRLSAPTMPDLTITVIRSGNPIPVEIWDDAAEAIDQGQAAAEWLTRYLGKPLRLVCMADDYMRPVSRKYAVTPEDQVSFADGYPILLTTQAALDDLNARLTVPIPMNRFRANLVVSGSDPFAEDTWKRIRIGEVEMAIVKPCARCDVPTHDQTSGEKMGKEPSATLAKFRNFNNKVMFGQNVIPLSEGRISVGDPVAVLE